MDGTCETLGPRLGEVDTEGSIDGKTDFVGFTVGDKLGLCDA